jgi:MYXO-CTERM domain-containing protein
MKGVLCGLILALVGMQGATASPISGSGAFTVESFDHDTFELLYTGDGSFRLRGNRVVTFGFTMLGVTWTEADIIDGLCECHESNGEPSIVLQFANDDGNGLLAWRFDDSTFRFSVTVGDLSMGGNNDGTDNPASGAFSRQNFRVVPGPAALALFVLVLFPLRQRQRR